MISHLAILLLSSTAIAQFSGPVPYGMEEVGHFLHFLTNNIYSSRLKDLYSELADIELFMKESSDKRWSLIFV